MPREVNAALVREHRERLESTFGVDAEETEEVVDDADLFAELARGSRVGLDGTSEEGYVGAGYVRVERDPDDLPPVSETMGDVGPEDPRILLILGRGTSDWGIPGGGREDGETWVEAATREVREETGIDCSVTGLCRLEHRVTVASDAVREAGLDPADADVGDRLHTLWAFFEGEYVDGSIGIQTAELNGAAWVRERPGRLYPDVRDVVDPWFEE